MKKLILPSLLLFVVLFTSCKKDDPATKTELLTNGSWNLTAMVSDDDGNGTYEYDDFADLDACEKDDFLTFKTNFELEINEGATRCNPINPQIDVTSWSFLNNETTLVIEGESNTILELNATTLKLKVDYGGNISSVITLTKR